MLSLAAQALGLSVFNTAVFSEQIQEIRVLEPNKMIFVFRDGHTAECAWQDKSRRDSWGKEAKQQARHRQLENMKKENSQCRQAPQE